MRYQAALHPETYYRRKLLRIPHTELAMPRNRNTLPLRSGLTMSKSRESLRPEQPNRWVTIAQHDNDVGSAGVAQW